MKKLTISIFFFGLVAMLSTTAFAQSVDPQERLKKHINDVVEEVHKTENPDEKRAVLNRSLGNLISTVDKVEGMDRVPEEDLNTLADLKQNLQDKKDELNGENGYAKVPANQLNNFANFVQQDLEQADTVVTLSLTTALLIVLILLLL
jgi:hypothetical protein